MANLIGTKPRASDILVRAGLHLHDYGKTPRPGRKLGHVTFVTRNRALRERVARQLRGRLFP
jgi:5-(carboxyamino)imidazole ribonucleotide synthase